MIDPNELTRKYGAAAPRYTSYPTAPHFNESVNEAVYRRWLADTNDPVSLYIHVPYCHQLCWYCGCNTRATQNYRTVERYTQALLNEAALVKRALSKRPLAQRLHWGGGTPTILTDEDFLNAMNKLRESFDFAGDAEIAVEIDPRTMTEGKAETLVRAGLTRASLGVQEFAEHVQEAINRRQPYQQVARSVAALRSAGVQSISFDLMYGLPNQTVADVEKTATLAAQLCPERVSVFGYAHVPWMKPQQRLINDDALPNEQERTQQALTAAHILEEAGYDPIGLDHFALPEDALSMLSKSGGVRRNFQGYTDDRAETLIGLGSSAIGSFSQGYIQNLTDSRSYIEAVNEGRLPVARGIEISGDDKLRRAIIERLMCDYSVDLASICEAHGVHLDVLDEERSRLNEFQKDGILTLDGDVITIAAEFKPYVRTVCTVFDEYFKTGKARHSRVI